MFSKTKQKMAIQLSISDTHKNLFLQSFACKHKNPLFCLKNLVLTLVKINCYTSKNELFNNQK